MAYCTWLKVLNVTCYKCDKCDNLSSHPSFNTFLQYSNKLPLSTSASSPVQKTTNSELKAVQ